MKKILTSVIAFFAILAANAELTRLVPEHGISKLFTLKSADTNREYRVSFYRPDVFRVQAAQLVEVEVGTNTVMKFDYEDHHNCPDYAQILVDEYKEDKSAVDFADKDGKFVFKTSEMIVEFDKATDKMTLKTWRGEELFTELEPLTFETNRTVQTIASTKAERVYGCGQQLGRFMHKGKEVLIECDYNWSDGGAPNPAPFMLSSKGYGILRHTFAGGNYYFDQEDRNVLSHDETRFDAFYFVGDFAKVIDRYTEATGRPNFIPMWGLELGDADAYMTRESDTKLPKQEEDGSFTEVTPVVVERVAEKYRADDMPGGWLLVNDGYGCGYTELASVCDKLRDLDFKTGLWTEGKLDRIAWEVGTAGTRIQKLDVAWTCQGGEQYKAQYPLNCNRDAFNGITQNANARGFCWAVLGWAGTQRYGICWAGDEYGGWDLIKYMIPGITGSAMSGQAYATTDVDGIFGGSAETYLRDLQWKCWTTAMYVMNGWSDVCKSPWSYEEPYKTEIRKALKHKIRMTPFLYALMRDAWETGAPIVRPLVYNYPQDSVLWDETTKYQFMVGRDVLVAPVYFPEKVHKGWWRKGVYLPKGEWYDYNDGRRVNGGQWLKAYPIDMTKIPVFVRAGAILPMYDEALTTSSLDRTRVTFDIWPSFSGTETVRLYEDDGSTLDYTNGAYVDRVVKVTSKQSDAYIGDMTIEIPAADGTYVGAPMKRIWNFDIHTQVKPAQILVDGYELMEMKSAKQGWYYDAEEAFGTIHIKTLPRCAKKGMKVVLRFTAPLSARVVTPDYPIPSEAEEAEAAEGVKVLAVDLLKNRTIVDGCDIVVTNGLTVLQRPESIYTKVKGHVATHPDNKAEARFTFRIYAGNHVTRDKLIFERANMKGKDVPQLIEVNLPVDVQNVRYEFTADDDSEASKSAKGVWKHVEYMTE